MISWSRREDCQRARISEAAFSHVDLDWQKYVRHDNRYDVRLRWTFLSATPQTKKILGWEPKTRFHDLVRIMVDADMALLARETPRQQLGKLP
jgi:GDPmannose 4,6-dehydratase